MCHFFLSFFLLGTFLLQFFCPRRSTCFPSCFIFDHFDHECYVRNLQFFFRSLRISRLIFYLLALSSYILRQNFFFSFFFFFYLLFWREFSVHPFHFPIVFLSFKWIRLHLSWILSFPELLQTSNLFSNVIAYLLLYLLVLQFFFIS